MRNLKSDILSREDIKLIITKFYDKLLTDEKMYPFFEDIIQQNQLEYHLNSISDFWNDILFGTITHKSNVMQKHLHKNNILTFKKTILQFGYRILTKQLLLFLKVKMLKK